VEVVLVGGGERRGVAASQFRLATLYKDGKGKLRHATKGFMQDIVDKFNLRGQFETEELKNKLKMAGLRGQAPLVAFMLVVVLIGLRFFRSTLD